MARGRGRHLAGESHPDRTWNTMGKEQMQLDNGEGFHSANMPTSLRLTLNRTLLCVRLWHNPHPWAVWDKSGSTPGQVHTERGAGQTLTTRVMSVERHIDNYPGSVAY